MIKDNMLTVGCIIVSTLPLLTFKKQPKVENTFFMQQETNYNCPNALGISSIRILPQPVYLLCKTTITTPFAFNLQQIHPPLQ